MSNEARTYVTRLKVGNVTAKYVLERLAERADEKYSCFPSIGLLAAEVEVSDRTIQRSLSLLRELSYVSDREDKRPNGSQTSNRYQLHGPWDDYAGTGVPFPEIVTPKQARAALWAASPTPGPFREGTAAAAAIAGDKAREEAAERVAEAVARTAAAKASQSERGRKAAAARRAQDEREDKPDAHSEPAADDVPTGEGGVTVMSPPSVTQMSPHPVTPASPLEPSVASLSADDGPSGVARVDAVGHLQVDGELGSDSGFAASGKAGDVDGSEGGSSTGAARGKRKKLTSEQQQARDAIMPLLPPDLAATFGTVMPKNVAQAMVDALAVGTPRQRTPQELVGHRVMPRWMKHWASEFYAGKLTPTLPSGKKKLPVGPLIEMLADIEECGNPRCEERMDFDRNEPCINCGMRATDQRANQKRDCETGQPAPVPGQRYSRSLLGMDGRECANPMCGRPLRSDSAYPLCPTHRRKDTQATWSDADVEAFEEFAAETTAEPDTEDVPSPETKDGVDEETARLRAQFARQFGTPEQQAAYCGDQGPAPF